MLYLKIRINLVFSSDFVSFTNECENAVASNRVDVLGGQLQGPAKVGEFGAILFFVPQKHKLK